MGNGFDMEEENSSLPESKIETSSDVSTAS